MKSHVKHLCCSRCRHQVPAGKLWSLCPRCAAPLLVEYRLEELAQGGSHSRWIESRTDMWRYRALLPVDSEEEIVSLGEGMTPLWRSLHLAGRYHLESLWIKDESSNPTASFKARGLSAAVTMARKLGARKLAIPTAGNAGGALAAYGARAGLEVHVFMPSDTPAANVMEARVAGAQVTMVDGVITDAARVLQESREEDWFDVSTLKEPYRLEGKKTMGYELAEQFGWTLPDVIFYPTGGGTGLIGMWKAFQEMEALGWIDGARPRMVAVQSSGCAPIVRAFERGEEAATPWENPRTFASGIRVPRAIGDFLMLRVLRESGGRAVAVEEHEIYQAVREAGAAEGIFMAPEGAACWAAARHLIQEGWIRPEERVVLFNTGSGLKYLDSFQLFSEQDAARGKPL